MNRLYLLCLVLVGSNIAVFVDTAATKSKGQDCDIFNEAISNCSTQIFNAQLDADSSLPNLTEYLIRANTKATITCTEPCFTHFQNYYECQGDTEDITSFNQFQCAQYEGMYCEPLVSVGFAEGTLMDGSVCDDYTFDVCSDECRNVTLNNLAVLGCCGRKLYRDYVFISTNATELMCGIDIDSFCSGSARLTASLFGAVIMVTMVAIGLLQ